MHFQESANGGIGGASTRPLIFPDRSDEVAVLVEKVIFLLVKGEDVVHGTTEESGMRFVALWKTIRAAVPEAAVKFVDGLGRRIEPVDGVTSVGQVEPRPPCECVE